MSYSKKLSIKKPAGFSVIKMQHILQMCTVFFDKCLGAAHSKHWLK